MKKKIFMTIICILIGAAILIFSCIDFISRNDMTVTRIKITEQRIRLFWKENGKLPSNLADLPILPSRDNKTTDGWGQELEYQIEGNTITLSSRGKPGVTAIVRSDRGATNTFDITKPPAASP
jgi:hypothetical protein